MTSDLRCRVFGHEAGVLVLDGGALRLRCVNCGWSSPGVGHTSIKPTITARVERPPFFTPATALFLRKTA